LECCGLGGIQPEDKALLANTRERRREGHRRGEVGVKDVRVAIEDARLKTPVRVMESPLAVKRCGERYARLPAFPVCEHPKRGVLGQPLGAVGTFVTRQTAIDLNNQRQGFNLKLSTARSSHTDEPHFHHNKARG
jgi:hypothetical protein